MGEEVAKARLLLVDDEASILLTLSAILRMHDFDVHTCGTVPQALAAINSHKFDVLLSDLNIGEAGDGFTVVSAMRRTQPEAVTIIITGYPAFETALQAMRSQVDDYVVKPTKTDELVQRIQDRLQREDRHGPPPLRKVSFVLEDAAETIIHRFVTALREQDSFPIEGLSPKQIANHVPQWVEELVAELRSGGPNGSRLLQGRTAERHGRTRLTQGFSIPMVVQEIRILRNIMFSVLQENLLSIDVSSLIPDMIYIGESLDQRLTETLRAYMTAERKLKSA